MQINDILAIIFGTLAIVNTILLIKLILKLYEKYKGD